MYICQRVRPNIEPAFSYLSIKVSKPTNGNEKKLMRVLDFQRYILSDRRIVSTDSLDEMLYGQMLLLLFIPTRVAIQEGLCYSEQELSMQNLANRN